MRKFHTMPRRIMTTYNEEERSDHTSLHFDIQVHREGDSKVIGCSKVFSDQTGPLLTDLTNRVLHIRREHLQRYFSLNYTKQ